MRLYLVLFISVLCFFTALRFTTKTKEIQSETKAINTTNNKAETIAIYEPIHIHTKFLCLQTALHVYILQEKSKNSKKLQRIQKGQKLCLNFPQDIPNTSMQITLKALEDKWLRVTLMGDSILLSGYIPLNVIKNGDRLQAKDMIDYSSGGEFLLNVPKITSENINLISGSFSIQHILQIAKEKLYLNDYDSVKTWLALAQRQNPEELRIYEIYADLLEHEGKNDEAVELMQKLDIAKSKIHLSR